MTKKALPSSGLNCPECWIDPEALPMVKLLNRLGFQTVYSCAGFGPSRVGLNLPLSCFPKGMGKAKTDAYGNRYFEKRKHDDASLPYVVINIPHLWPDWLPNVIKHLRKMKVDKADFYFEGLKSIGCFPLFRVPGIVGHQFSIHFGPDLHSFCELKDKDKEALKKIFLHEIIKAFSFI